MTRQQIERIDAVAHGSQAAVHLVRDGMTVATVRGLLHGREAGCDPRTPWLVADHAGVGSTCYLHPDDPAVIVSAEASVLVVRIEL